MFDSQGIAYCVVHALLCFSMFFAYFFIAFLPAMIAAN